MRMPGGTVTHMTKWKKPVSKHCALCIRLCGILGNADCGDSSVINGRRKRGEMGGANAQNTESFRGSDDTRYDILTVDICHHTLVWTHGMSNTKGDPDVIGGQWWLCRVKVVPSIMANVPLWWGVEKGGDCMCRGGWVYGNSPYLHLDFAVNLKLP